ncbi:integrase domain-containing protein, partial [Klebsiella pneumoniae]|uniref:integrase domain-containing protein n=1 Tax=Klebsiella pneumoniae TaxID=573 RepID=UPI001D1842EE
GLTALSAEFTIGEGELMAHDVPLGCAPDEYDDLISGTCSHLPYRNIVKDAGLTGKISPHSLRYAYSREATEYHMQRGFSKKEAEALVSMDLGHGDGRGHYVARVYNKGEPHDD